MSNLGDWFVKRAHERKEIHVCEEVSTAIFRPRRSEDYSSLALRAIADELDLLTDAIRHQQDLEAWELTAEAICDPEIPPPERIG